MADTLFGEGGASHVVRKCIISCDTISDKLFRLTYYNFQFSVFTLNNSFGKEVSLFSPRSSLVREASLCSKGTFVYNRASMLPIPFALRSNRYTDFGFVELKSEKV